MVYHPYTQSTHPEHLGELSETARVLYCISDTFFGFRCSRRGEGAPGSGHTYDHTRLPFMLVERASKATRQRGPPPQGSTASHKRYVVGGDTLSTSRHRHP